MKKKAGGKDNSTTNHQELKMRETRGTFLKFSGAEINKREVSFPKIIFRVPMMRQNLREWLATDVNINYVCVADTHQHHLLLFPSHYTLNDKTHTYSHLHCQLMGELGLPRGWIFYFYFFLNHTCFIISRKQRINILKILPQSLLPRVHIIKLHSIHYITWAVKMDKDHKQKQR